MQSDIGHKHKALFFVHCWDCKDFRAKISQLYLKNTFSDSWNITGPISAHCGGRSSSNRLGIVVKKRFKKKNQKNNYWRRDVSNSCFFFYANFVTNLLHCKLANLIGLLKRTFLQSHSRFFSEIYLSNMLVKHMNRLLKGFRNNLLSVVKAKLVNKIKLFFDVSFSDCRGGKETTTHQCVFHLFAVQVFLFLFFSEEASSDPSACHLVVHSLLVAGVFFPKTRRSRNS